MAHSCQEPEGQPAVTRSHPDLPHGL